MKILFWLTSSRGSRRFEVLNIAKRTAENKQAMDDFLLAWAKKSNCWDSCNNVISYGYEAPTKTRNFLLTSKPLGRVGSKCFESRFMSKTAGTKEMKKKTKLQQWYMDRGVVGNFLRDYSIEKVVNK
jgi:hypothetical protein